MTAVLEAGEALDEQRPIDARQTSDELVEAMGTVDELAHDQRCPAVGHDLGGARNLAVLVVAVAGVHAGIAPPAMVGVESENRTLRHAHTGLGSPP